MVNTQVWAPPWGGEDVVRDSEGRDGEGEGKDVVRGIGSCGEGEGEVRGGMVRERGKNEREGEEEE